MFWSGVIGMIVLVDCGLSEEGEKLSRMLERKDRWVAVCRKDEISGYLAG